MIQSTISYKRHRFPPSLIAHAVWLYFRFPLSLRLIEEMLLERGIVVSYETIRCWAKKFGLDYAGRLRRKPPSPGDIWHLDEVVVTIGGRKHWPWRAVDQDGYVLDEIAQTSRSTKAAKPADPPDEEAGMFAEAYCHRQAWFLWRRAASGHTCRGASIT